MANLTVLGYHNSSDRASLSTVEDQRVLHLWLVVNGFLLLCSCILFSLLLAVLIIQRKFKSGSGLLILHQVLAEYQVATVHFFHYLLVVYKSRWTFWVDNSYCHHYMFSYMITVTACQWGLVYLALNRFVAVCFPWAYGKWTRKWVVCLMAASCWVYGFACFAPFYFGLDGGMVSNFRSHGTRFASKYNNWPSASEEYRFDQTERDSVQTVA